MYRDALDDDGLDFLRRGPRTSAERLAYAQRVHPEAYRNARPAPDDAQAALWRHRSLDGRRHFVGPDRVVYMRDDGIEEPLHASIRRGYETAVPGFQRTELGEVLAQSASTAPVSPDSPEAATGGWHPAYRAGPMRVREIEMWSSQAEPADVGNMAQRDRVDVLRLLRHRDEIGSISPSERDLAGAITGDMRMDDGLWAHQRPKDELFRQLLTVDPAVQRGMAAWKGLDDE